MEVSYVEPEIPWWGAGDGGVSVNISLHIA